MRGCSPLKNPSKKRDLRRMTDNPRKRMLHTGNEYITHGAKDIKAVDFSEKITVSG